MTSCYYQYQIALGLFVNPLVNTRTIYTIYLTKESRQRILVLIVYDAIKQIAHYTHQLEILSTKYSNYRAAISLVSLKYSI